MMLFAFPKFLLVAIVCIVVFAVVRAARRKAGGQGGGWMPLVAGIIVAVVFALFAAPFFVYRMARSTAHVASPNVTPDVQAGATWVDALAKEGANVTPHTSMRSAGRFLAERVGDAVAKVGGEGTPIELDTGDAGPCVAEAVHAKLAPRLETAVEADELNPLTYAAAMKSAWDEALGTASSTSPGELNAREHFTEGRTAYKRGDWLLAGAHFEAARTKAYKPGLFEDSPETYLKRLARKQPAALAANAAGTAVEPTTKPAVTRVVLSWENRDTEQATWWPVPMISGTIRADVTGPGGSAVATADVVEKPWLRSEHSSYTVSATTAPTSDEADARQHARQAAIARLTPALRARLLELGGRDVPDETLHKHLAAAVNAKRGLVDEALVRVDRPYGAVYYAAQLHDVRPAAIDPIARAAMNETRATRQSWAGMAGALGGMLAVLGVLYLALNALTRGYFRAHLGAALAVVLVLGTVVIVLLLG